MIINSLDILLSSLEPGHCSMSDSNCCFLTCIQVSHEAGKVVWYSHQFKNFLQFVVIYTVKGFSVVNEAETDIFLELSCFFNDPADVSNLICGSSTFLKTILNIWKSSVHKVLKPNLKDFEHYLARMWNECNCVVVWTLLALPFFGIRMKNELFQLWPVLSFPNLLTNWVQHFSSSIF